jgi:hypothetical protein
MRQIKEEERMAKVKAPAKTAVKSATKKAPAKKALAKRATKKSPAKRNASKGDSYVCGVCGLAVTVDEACGCADVCEIMCCSKPMKKNAAKARTAKK